MIGQIWETIVDLWDTGNWAIRVAILSVVLPPFAALVLALFGLNAVAAAVALVPLLALVFVPLSLIDPLVIGIVAVALGLAPTVEAIRGWLARWIPLYVGSVLALGTYLFFVPVGNNPGLALPLVASSGGAALFAASGSRGAFVRWVTRALSAVALGTTVAFFFSGKEEVKLKAEELAVIQAEPRVQEFTLNVGEEIDAVATGPGTQHRYLADKEWILVSAAPEQIRCPYRRPDGFCEFPMGIRGSIIGTSSAGPARVKAGPAAMTIRFERVR